MAYDPKTQAIVAHGTAPQVSVPAGWRASDVIAGSWSSPQGPIALYGKANVAAGTATVGSAGAKVLKVSDGGTVNPGGKTLTLTIVGTARLAGSSRAGQTLHCRLHTLCEVAMAATTGCMLAVML